MQVLSVSGRVLQISDAQQSLVLVFLRGPSCSGDAFPCKESEHAVHFPHLKPFFFAWCVFFPEQSSQGELGGWQEALRAGSVPLLLALLSLVLLSARKPSAHTND